MNSFKITLTAFITSFLYFLCKIFMRRSSEIYSYEIATNLNQEHNLTFEGRGNGGPTMIVNFSMRHQKMLNEEKKFVRRLNHKNEHDVVRILHIVTSFAEYNNGDRNTVRGQDRMVEVFLPILQQSLYSMLEVSDWKVDVYIILGYRLLPERRLIIENAMPESVGLEIWDDAIPIGYPKGETRYTAFAPHALARQHRFVLKDKLEYYDFFSAWEDDMLITSAHIQNFMNMTKAINDLKLNPASRRNNHPVHGPLNMEQLNRLIPGFIRVEVSDQTVYERRDIPPCESVRSEFNPNICCDMPNVESRLRPDDIILWETDVKALGVRKLPGSLDWVAFLPATSTKEGVLDSYWSGEDGAYGNDKRPGRDGKYFAQQAGFMASKEQILYFDSVCPGGFLPPFDDVFWGDQSGLKPQNVEFWSGGYQLFGRCWLQRIISLDPSIFSHQLLYHTANNKQNQMYRNRLVKAVDLLGQLHTVKHSAISKSVD